MNARIRLCVLVVAVVVFSFCVLSQTPEVLQAEIPGVIRAGTRPVLIKDGFNGLEGPTRTPDGGLYFSATTENRTYNLDAKGEITVWREGTNGTNGLYLARDGRLLGAESNASRLVAVSPGRIVMPIATTYKGVPLRAPNDLIADRKGGIYFTDPARRPAPDVAPKEPGNVYYIRPDGELTLVDDSIGRPNGITLNIDEKTLYVDDTEGEYVYSFDVQKDGSIKNKRPFVKLHDPEKTAAGVRSRADGMARDSKGRIYVATASGVQVIAPNGKYLGTIHLPAVARNLAFAGPNRRTLYLTTINALYRIGMLSDGPKDRAK